MYIVIVGAGEVGFHIATIIIKEGHEVAIVDRDPSNFRRASEELDSLVLFGNGAGKKISREAHIARAKILVAVTDADEVNIVACMAAKHVGVPPDDRPHSQPRLPGRRPLALNRVRGHRPDDPTLRSRCRRDRQACRRFWRP